MSPATLAGCGALILWAFLALLSRLAAGIPPLQLTAMGFAIGGGVGLAVVLARCAGNIDGRWRRLHCGAGEVGCLVRAAAARPADASRCCTTRAGPASSAHRRLGKDSK
ncbi:MAG: hypothetical protein ACK5WN_03615 [Alphaproteobacteria bacterium]